MPLKTETKAKIFLNLFLLTFETDKTKFRSMIFNFLIYCFKRSLIDPNFVLHCCCQKSVAQELLEVVKGGGGCASAFYAQYHRKDRYARRIN